MTMDVFCQWCKILFSIIAIDFLPRAACLIADYVAKFYNVVSNFHSLAAY
jgi:hypothetical protein